MSEFTAGVVIGVFVGSSVWVGGIIAVWIRMNRHVKAAMSLPAGSTPASVKTAVTARKRGQMVR